VVLFFFQAEDGIRDFHVTGVQTCALPISAIVGAAMLEIGSGMSQVQGHVGIYVMGMVVAAVVGYASISLIITLVRQDHFHFFSRSEERRVGKECRCWRAADDCK